jgi:hypothetical protein
LKAQLTCSSSVFLKSHKREEKKKSLSARAERRNCVKFMVIYYSGTNWNVTSTGCNNKTTALLTIIFYTFLSLSLSLTPRTVNDSTESPFHGIYTSSDYISPLAVSIIFNRAFPLNTVFRSITGYGLLATLIAVCHRENQRESNTGSTQTID